MQELLEKCLSCTSYAINVRKKKQGRTPQVDRKVRAQHEAAHQLKCAHESHLQQILTQRQAPSRSKIQRTNFEQITARLKDISIRP